MAGGREERADEPLHPYAQELRDAHPRPEPDGLHTSAPPAGEASDAARMPNGCRFHPRCPVSEVRCERRSSPPCDSSPPAPDRLPHRGRPGKDALGGAEGREDGSR